MDCYVTRMCTKPMEAFAILLTIHLLNASDSDRDPMSLSIVQQPTHGTVSPSDNAATHHADLHYAGPDSFTYAAWDGDTNSNLGKASVTVSDGTGSLSTSAIAPGVALLGSNTPFRASGTRGGHSESFLLSWAMNEVSHCQANSNRSFSGYTNPKLQLNPH